MWSFTVEPVCNLSSQASGSHSLGQHPHGRMKRDCSAVLCPFCTTSQLQQEGQQVTHPHESKWVTGSTLMGEDGLALPRVEAGIPCPTHVSLTGSELWAEAVTWKVKRLRKSSQTTLFLILPVPAWAAIPKWDPPHRDHPCDGIPSQTEILLGMLRAAKQAAGLCPATSGASLPSGQLWDTTISQAGLSCSALVRQNLGYMLKVCSTKQPLQPAAAQAWRHPNGTSTPKSTFHMKNPPHGTRPVTACPPCQLGLFPISLCSPCRGAVSKAQLFDSWHFMGLSTHWVGLGAAGKAWFCLQFAEIPTNIFRKWKSWAGIGLERKINPTIIEKKTD